MFICLWKVFLLFTLIIAIYGKKSLKKGAKNVSSLNLRRRTQSNISLNNTSASDKCDICPCPDISYVHNICGDVRDIVVTFNQTMILSGCFCYCLQHGSRAVRYVYPEHQPLARDQRQGDRMRFYNDVLNHRNLTCGGVFVAFYEDESSYPISIRRKLFEMKVPMLSHSLISESIGNSQYVIFEPEYKFIRTNGFKDIITKVREHNQKNYVDKIPKVIWRGMAYSAIWGSWVNERFNLSITCKNQNISWCDAGISQAVDVGQDWFYNLVGVIKDYVPEENWNHYRGMFDVTGTTNPGGLYWRMASGTVVFKIDSKWSSSIIEKMIPWVNYIPIKEDLSDLYNVTQIVVTDSFAPLLQRIANEAYELSKEFTYEKELDRVANELQAIWSS